MIAASFASPFANPVSFLCELTAPFHENVREKNALSSRRWSMAERFSSSVLTFIVLGIIGSDGTKEARDMTFHDPEDARRWRRRLKRQREYQRKYRERLIAERTPERSDIATACLEACMTISRGQFSELQQLAKAIVDRLVSRGFDRAQSIERIQQVAAKLQDRARREAED
ncbi:conserved hypothetical protein [Hyphomicrobiales bacterium]|nr:conserved hypothetical protein [Hyphomicrobiales bacterium]CAH1700581.1 hypothetical protein BOSEA1005_20280 [Hyphomicrobiales bacterium]CAI0344429.1 conserved hypothetical protein [Hyphomicrobiales bacterium]